MAIVVQALSQANQVLSQHVISGDSFTLGRGYYCEHRIEDPYVCEEHARIYLTDNAQIAIEDKQSLNGTMINGELIRNSSVDEDCAEPSIIRPEDIIVLGRSRFRVFLANTKVSATKKLNQLDVFLDQFNKKRILAALFVFFTGFTCLETYLSSSSELEAGTFMTALIGALTLLCLPVLLVSLLAVLNKKESRLLILFNLTLSAFIVGALLAYVFAFARFNIDNASIVYHLETILYWIIVIITLYLVLYVAFRQSMKKRLGIICGLVLVYMGVQYTPQIFNNNDFISPPNANASVMAPALRVNASQSTERFIGNAIELFEQAEQTIDD